MKQHTWRQRFPSLTCLPSTINTKNVHCSFRAGSFFVSNEHLPIGVRACVRVWLCACVHRKWLKNDTTARSTQHTHTHTQSNSVKGVLAPGRVLTKRSFVFLIFLRIVDTFGAHETKKPYKQWLNVGNGQVRNHQVAEICIKNIKFDMRVVCITTRRSSKLESSEIRTCSYIGYNGNQQRTAAPTDYTAKHVNILF